jgi:hypothetical protein
MMLADLFFVTSFALPHASLPFVPVMSVPLDPAALAGSGASRRFPDMDRIRSLLRDSAAETLPLLQARFFLCIGPFGPGMIFQQANDLAE